MNKYKKEHGHIEQKETIDLETELKKLKEELARVNLNFPVNAMCSVLKVSRNGYYHWCKYGSCQEATICLISVVGYAMADHMKSALICQALRAACYRREGVQKDAIFHFERGSQYASQEYRELLETFQMRQSMSAKGNCYDNAACESFFGSMKTELILPAKVQNKKEAEESIIHYIGFYNTKRLHSYNGYCSPVEMELMWWQSRFRESA